MLTVYIYIWSNVLLFGKFLCDWKKISPHSFHIGFKLVTNRKLLGLNWKLCIIYCYTIKTIEFFWTVKFHFQNQRFLTVKNGSMKNHKHPWNLGSLFFIVESAKNNGSFKNFSQHSSYMNPQVCVKTGW